MITNIRPGEFSAQNPLIANLKIKFSKPNFVEDHFRICNMYIFHTILSKRALDNFINEGKLFDKQENKINVQI